MLQNRVDPQGNLISTSARGAWLGNRGVIHNDRQEITRAYKLEAWITCRLCFKNRHREIMQPKRWTELFFLDEVTAFSAGHRPCAECRRDAFNNFKAHWLKGNPAYGFSIKTSIREIDRVLHQERINHHQQKIVFQEEVNNIPDGAFVLIDSNPFLVLNQHLHGWSAFGYEKSIALPLTGKLTVVTPKSILYTFRAGYIPQNDITTPR